MPSEASITGIEKALHPAEFSFAGLPSSVLLSLSVVLPLPLLTVLFLRIFQSCIPQFSPSKRFLLY
jgi:hypothetical protein